MTKKILTTIGVSAVTVLALGSYATGAFDPVTFQNQLDNHTARIDNLEVKTGTTPPPPTPVTLPATNTVTYVTAPSAIEPVPVTPATPVPTPVPTPTPTQITGATTATTNLTQPYDPWKLSDIDAVLQSIAPRGEKLVEKQAACRQSGTDHHATVYTIQNTCTDFDLRNFASY